VDPTGYDAASVDAVTAIALSAHSGTAVVDGLAEPDGDVVGEAEVGLADGLFVGEVEGLEVGEVEGEASEEPAEPNARW